MMNHFSLETVEDRKGKELPAQHFISSASVLSKKGKTKGFQMKRNRISCHQIYSKRNAEKGGTWMV